MAAQAKVARRGPAERKLERELFGLANREGSILQQLLVADFTGHDAHRWQTIGYVDRWHVVRCSATEDGFPAWIAWTDVGWTDTIPTPPGSLKLGSAHLLLVRRWGMGSDGVDGVVIEDQWGRVFQLPYRWGAKKWNEWELWRRHRRQHAHLYRKMTRAFLRTCLQLASDLSCNSRQRK